MQKAFYSGLQIIAVLRHTRGAIATSSPGGAAQFSPGRKPWGNVKEDVGPAGKAMPNWPNISFRWDDTVGIITRQNRRTWGSGRAPGASSNHHLRKDRASHQATAAWSWDIQLRTANRNQPTLGRDRQLEILRVLRKRSVLIPNGANLMCYSSIMVSTAYFR